MELANYNENGYILIKKLIDQDDCVEMLEWISKIKDFSEKDYEAYSNVPYMYDNILTEKSPFNKIINNKKILSLSECILGQKSKFYFLKVNNKSKWIGQDICYHQEFAVSKHMGLEKDDSIQMFIALEPHYIDNGCLKIIEKSHKDGEIEHEDFFDPNFNHKLRLNYEKMEELNKKYKLKNCILEPGDCLIFNQFLVHGSASNKSNLGRKAIVGWITKENFVFDEEKNKKFWIKRQNITYKTLQKKLEETKLKINNFNNGLKLIKK